ncbi:MAG: hypothetical protein AAB507_01645 [Patescibacteria group bacterium]
MINLLPDGYKGQIEKEYRGRLLIVALIFIFLTEIVSIMLLLPSYFISETKYYSALNRTLKDISANGADSLKTSDAIKKINDKIALLKISGGDKAQVGALINSIVAQKYSAIAIKSINYEMRGSTAKIDVLGVAKSRESLLGFVDRLKKEKYFAEVYSPVSNLVKDRNIDFSIQIAITP